MLKWNFGNMGSLNLANIETKKPRHFETKKLGNQETKKPRTPRPLNNPRFFLMHVFSIKGSNTNLKRSLVCAGKVPLVVRGSVHRDDVR